MYILYLSLGSKAINYDFTELYNIFNNYIYTILFNGVQCNCNVAIWCCDVIRIALAIINVYGPGAC